MSNIRQYWAPYLGPFANVEAFHMGGGTSPGFGQFGAFINPGQLGNRVIEGEVGPGYKEYQMCQIDSGAVAATPTGAIAQGQLMYWKSRTSYLVTNDVRFSDTYNGTARNGVQSVAGVLVTPTANASSALNAIPGDAVYLQIKGRCNLVLSAQASPSQGDFVIPNNSATVPQVNNSAVGTAPGDTLVGRFLSSTVTTSVSAGLDLQLPGIP